MPILMRPLLLTFLFALALVVSAQAQDPQVDPGSPAGTEYQLPVDRAREEAGGAAGGGSGPRGPGGSQDDSAGADAPLFGAGVEDDQRQKQTGSGSNKSGTDSDPATVGEVEPDLGTATPETVRAQAPAPDSGSGLVAIGGGAAGVLLLGGLAGLAWRRRSMAG